MREQSDPRAIGANSGPENAKSKFARLAELCQSISLGLDVVVGRLSNLLPEFYDRSLPQRIRRGLNAGA